MKKEHTKLKEAALKYHSEGRPGKLEVIPIKPFGSQRQYSVWATSERWPANPSWKEKDCFSKHSPT